MRSHQYCIVPACKNTAKNNPNKVFFQVPVHKMKRTLWLEAVGNTNYSNKSKLFVCEDHFNLEEDMENYLQMKVMGARKRMKPGVVPHLALKDITQPVTSPAKKKLRPILPRRNTRSTTTGTDLETTLLSSFHTNSTNGASSSADSTAKAQCSKDNTEQSCSSPNTRKKNFEEIYIKEEHLEENVNDYKYMYGDPQDGVKEESDEGKCGKNNKNEIDSKEENAIMRINEQNMENISDKEEENTNETKEDCNGLMFFQCTICKKRFKEEEYLISHMNTHSESKNNTCPFCNKLFTVKRSLKRHLHNDTKIKQFLCPMCNVTFTQKCSQKRHMEEYHSKGKMNKKNEKIASELNVPTEESYIKQQVIEKDSI